MVAIKNADIDAFVARPDPARPVVLVFGPDAGLVHERAEALARSAVDDPDDPFALVRIDGDALSADPARLADEANTIPLFGGRRAIWVRATARNIVPALELVLDAPAPDCRIVIEAGDLRRNAPLRTLVERAKTGAALPCYADGERDIARLIDEEMRAAKLQIEPDAQAMLVSLLGGDRQASRSEIRKLALYAHGGERVTLDDVMAVAADGSALALDALVDAAFAGRTADVEHHYAKLRTAGTGLATILLAAQRHVAQLHRLRLTLEAGTNVASVMASMRPPLHFSRKPLVEAALRTWNAARLLRVMQQLAEASLESRRQSALADAIAQRAMLTIATHARRRD